MIEYRGGNFLSYPHLFVTTGLVVPHTVCVLKKIHLDLDVFMKKRSGKTKLGVVTSGKQKEKCNFTTTKKT